MCAFPAKYLLPAECQHIDFVPVDFLGEDGAGRICNRQSFTVGCNPITIGNANARGCAVPCEDDVIRPIDLRKIGQFAIIGAKDCRVDLELLHSIGHPAFAEAFPGKRCYRTLAQHRPHGHFNRTGI